MRLPLWLPFALAASLAVAGRAQAQTPPGRLRIFAAAQFGPNWDDVRYQTLHIPGHVPESGISVGLESARAGIEVDVNVPSAWHVRQSGPRRYRYVGQTYKYQQQGHFYESTTTTRHRSTEMAILYRRNLHPRRISSLLTMTWLVGAASVLRPNESARVTKEVMADGSPVEVDRHQDRSSRDYLAGVGGLDAAVKLSAHLAIVARLRVTAFPSMLDDSGSAPRAFMAHPQIAVRWTF